jgi:arylformamidase
LTHNALFPHDCIHVENLGGDIGLKELHNKRITLGVFPWKFKGGEAAFCRAVAWLYGMSLRGGRRPTKRPPRR